MVPDPALRACLRPPACGALITVTVLFLLAPGVAVTFVRAENSGAPAAPVLVELFTSEGCSTCPPADALIQRMDSMQPIHGASLIVLSEHVDYWDHEGWKDPYSSHAFTERQADYVRALKLREPYTPQVIIDGRQVLDGGPQQIEKALVTAATAPKVFVRIESLKVEPGALHAHVDVAGTANERAQVVAALALDHAESLVLKGENGGKRLRHVAVVEQMKKLGDVGKGKDFSQDVQLKLKPGTDPKNLRLVVFVQEAGPGKVLGAAMQRTGD